MEEGEEESAVVAKMRREEDWDVMCKWTFVWRLFESGKETWIGSAVEVGRVPFGGEVEVMVPLNFFTFYSENTAGHIIVCFNPGTLPLHRMYVKVEGIPSSKPFAFFCCMLCHGKFLPKSPESFSVNGT